MNSGDRTPFEFSFGRSGFNVISEKKLPVEPCLKMTAPTLAISAWIGQNAYWNLFSILYRKPVRSCTSCSHIEKKIFVLNIKAAMILQQTARKAIEIDA